MIKTINAETISPLTRKELQELYDQLSGRIKKSTECFRGKKIRAGISCCIETTVENIPRHHDHFFSYFTSDEIPPELIKFFEDYSTRLIAERLIVWHQLQQTDLIN